MIDINFNSIKVQLEQSILRAKPYTERNFNSIKVQLEPLAPELFNCRPDYFNSIKVQLEPQQTLPVDMSVT